QASRQVIGRRCRVESSTTEDRRRGVAGRWHLLAERLRADACILPTRRRSVAAVRSLRDAASRSGHHADRMGRRTTLDRRKRQWRDDSRDCGNGARPCHAFPLERRARERVHAAYAVARQDSPQPEAGIRSTRHLQSGTNVRGPLVVETHLADWIKDTPQGKEAEEILRTCVHCGFCTATCPTYLLLGDELDGPRG